MEQVFIIETNEAPNLGNCLEHEYYSLLLLYLKCVPQLQTSVFTPIDVPNAVTTFVNNNEHD